MTGLEPDLLRRLGAGESIAAVIQAAGLSRGEFEVVALLALNAGADIGYRALYDALRGDGFMAGQGEEGYRANVRAMIKRIRRKFTTLDPDFDALGTYPGVGYRWRADG